MCKDHKADNVSLYPQLQDVLTEFFEDYNNLIGVWTDVFQLPRIASIEEARLFCNGYRIIFNYLRHHAPALFEPKIYFKILIKSMVSAALLKRSHIASFIAILPELSSHVQNELLGYLSENPNLGYQILRELDVSIAMRLLQLAMKKFDIEALLNSSGVDALLSALSDSALPTGSELDLEDEYLATLFLRTALDSLTLTVHIAKLATDALIRNGRDPAEASIRIILMAGRLWGEKLLVQAPHRAKTRTYLTRVLLSCLDRQDVPITSTSLMSVLYSPFEDGSQASPALILSIGISNYLDSNDSKTRLNGMRVARSYSIRMGRELHFQELVDFEVHMRHVTYLSCLIPLSSLRWPKKMSHNHSNEMLQILACSHRKALRRPLTKMQMPVRREASRGMRLKTNHDMKMCNSRPTILPCVSNVRVYLALFFPMQY